MGRPHQKFSSTTSGGRDDQGGSSGLHASSSSNTAQPKIPVVVSPENYCLNDEELYSYSQISSSTTAAVNPHTDNKKYIDGESNFNINARSDSNDGNLNQFLTYKHPLWFLDHHRAKPGATSATSSNDSSEENEDGLCPVCVLPFMRSRAQDTQASPNDQCRFFTLKPCTQCDFRVCSFCYDKILEAVDKNNDDGISLDAKACCPACRAAYEGKYITSENKRLYGEYLKGLKIGRGRNTTSRQGGVTGLGNKGGSVSSIPGGGGGDKDLGEGGTTGGGTGTMGNSAVNRKAVNSKKHLADAVVFDGHSVLFRNVTSDVFLPLLLMPWNSESEQQTIAIEADNAISLAAQSNTAPKGNFEAPLLEQFLTTYYDYGKQQQQGAVSPTDFLCTDTVTPQTDDVSAEEKRQTLPTSPMLFQNVGKHSGTTWEKKHSSFETPSTEIILDDAREKNDTADNEYLADSTDEEDDDLFPECFERECVFSSLSIPQHSSIIQKHQVGQQSSFASFCNTRMNFFPFAHRPPCRNNKEIRSILRGVMSLDSNVTTDEYNFTRSFKERFSDKGFKEGRGKIENAGKFQISFLRNENSNATEQQSLLPMNPVYADKKWIAESCLKKLMSVRQLSPMKGAGSNGSFHSQHNHFHPCYPTCESTATTGCSSPALSTACVVQLFLHKHQASEVNNDLLERSTDNLMSRLVRGSGPGITILSDRLIDDLLLIGVLNFPENYGAFVSKQNSQDGREITKSKFLNTILLTEPHFNVMEWTKNEKISFPMMGNSQKNDENTINSRNHDEETNLQKEENVGRKSGVSASHLKTSELAQLIYFHRVIESKKRGMPLTNILKRVPAPSSSQKEETFMKNKVSQGFSYFQDFTFYMRALTLILGCLIMSEDADYYNYPCFDPEQHIIGENAPSGSSSVVEGTSNSSPLSLLYHLFDSLMRKATASEDGKISSPSTRYGHNLLHHLSITMRDFVESPWATDTQGNSSQIHTNAGLCAILIRVLQQRRKRYREFCSSLVGCSHSLVHAATEALVLKRRTENRTLLEPVADKPHQSGHDIGGAHIYPNSYLFVSSSNKAWDGNINCSIPQTCHNDREKSEIQGHLQLCRLTLNALMQKYKICTLAQDVTFKKTENNFKNGSNLNTVSFSFSPLLSATADNAEYRTKYLLFVAMAISNYLAHKQHELLGVEERLTYMKQYSRLGKFGHITDCCCYSPEGDEIQEKEKGDYVGNDKNKGQQQKISKKMQLMFESDTLMKNNAKSSEGKKSWACELFYLFFNQSNNDDNKTRNCKDSFILPLLPRRYYWFIFRFSSVAEAVNCVAHFNDPSNESVFGLFAPLATAAANVGKWENSSADNADKEKNMVGSHVGTKRENDGDILSLKQISRLLSGNTDITWNYNSNGDINKDREVLFKVTSLSPRTSLMVALIPTRYCHHFLMHRPCRRQYCVELHADVTSKYLSSNHDKILKTTNIPSILLSIQQYFFASVFVDVSKEVDYDNKPGENTRNTAPSKENGSDVRESPSGSTATSPDALWSGSPILSHQQITKGKWPMLLIKSEKNAPVKPLTGDLASLTNIISITGTTNCYTTFANGGIGNEAGGDYTIKGSQSATTPSFLIVVHSKKVNSIPLLLKGIRASDINLFGGQLCVVPSHPLSISATTATERTSKIFFPLSQLTSKKTDCNNASYWLNHYHASFFKIKNNIPKKESFSMPSSEKTVKMDNILLSVNHLTLLRAILISSVQAIKATIDALMLNNFYQNEYERVNTTSPDVPFQHQLDITPSPVDSFWALFRSAIVTRLRDFYDNFRMGTGNRLISRANDVILLADEGRKYYKKSIAKCGFSTENNTLSADENNFEKEKLLNEEEEEKLKCRARISALLSWLTSQWIKTDGKMKQQHRQQRSEKEGGKSKREKPTKYNASNNLIDDKSGGALAAKTLKELPLEIQKCLQEVQEAKDDTKRKEKACSLARLWEMLLLLTPELVMLDIEFRDATTALLAKEKWRSESEKEAVTAHHFEILLELEQEDIFKSYVLPLSEQGTSPANRKNLQDTFDELWSLVCFYNISFSRVKNMENHHNTFTTSSSQLFLLSSHVISLSIRALRLLITAKAIIMNQAKLSLLVPLPETPLDNTNSNSIMFSTTLPQSPSHCTSSLQVVTQFPQSRALLLRRALSLAALYRTLVEDLLNASYLRFTRMASLATETFAVAAGVAALGASIDEKVTGIKVTEGEDEKEKKVLDEKISENEHTVDDEVASSDISPSVHASGSDDTELRSVGTEDGNLIFSDECQGIEEALSMALECICDPLKKAVEAAIILKDNFIVGCVKSHNNNNDNHTKMTTPPTDPEVNIFSVNGALRRQSLLSYYNVGRGIDLSLTTINVSSGRPLKNCNTCSDYLPFSSVDSTALSALLTTTVLTPYIVTSAWGREAFCCGPVTFGSPLLCNDVLLTTTEDLFLTTTSNGGMRSGGPGMLSSLSLVPAVINVKLPFSEKVSSIERDPSLPQPSLLTEGLTMARFTEEDPLCPDDGIFEYPTSCSQQLCEDAKKNIPCVRKTHSELSKKEDETDNASTNRETPPAPQSMQNKTGGLKKAKTVSPTENQLTDARFRRGGAPAGRRGLMCQIGCGDDGGPEENRSLLAPAVGGGGANFLPRGGMGPQVKVDWAAIAMKNTKK